MKFMYESVLYSFSSSSLSGYKPTSSRSLQFEVRILFYLKRKFEKRLVFSLTREWATYIELMKTYFHFYMVSLFLKYNFISSNLKLK